MKTTLYFINVFKITLKYQEAIIVKCSIFLFLVATFWLNITLTEFHTQYEYENFGIKIKTVITKKYAGQKTTRYHFNLKTPDVKEIQITLGGEKYAHRKIGDTILVIYTPRYPDLTKIM